MYKFKFSNITFVSNKKYISKNKVIFFIYGIGNCSDDFKFIFKKIKKNYQILIPELPGHNNIEFNKISIEKFTQTIALFIKKKKLLNLTFFTHSVGGIIPILLFKKFLKKNHIKKFVNYEGNLTVFDTKTVTRKTSNYKINEFKIKFRKLKNLCKNSNSHSLNLWSESLDKTNYEAFYQISKDAVKYSVNRKLLEFFRIFFKKKMFLFGSNTNLIIPHYSFGPCKLKINNCGHFAFFENSYKFSIIFSNLIYGRLF